MIFISDLATALNGVYTMKKLQIKVSLFSDLKSYQPSAHSTKFYSAIHTVYTPVRLFCVLI